MVCDRFAVSNLLYYYFTLQNSTLYLPQGSSAAVLDDLSEAAFDVLARKSNRQNATEGENITDTACELQKLSPIFLSVML